MRMHSADEKIAADSGEGFVFLNFKVLFFPHRSRLECGKQEMQTFLGQFTEQLFCGFGLHKGDEDRKIPDSFQKAGGNVDEKKPDDLYNASLRLFHHQRAGEGYLTVKNSDDLRFKLFQKGGDLIAQDVAAKKLGDLRYNLFQKGGDLITQDVGVKKLDDVRFNLFQKGGKGAAQPGSAPSNVAEDQSTGDQMLLEVLLRNLVACTRIFKRSIRGFARVQGEPATMMEAAAPGFEEDTRHSFETGAPDGKPGVPRFNVKLPNMETLMELVPQLGKAPQSFPDKRKLFSVEDFFKYTESEGRKLFDELDRDKDGQVTLEDVELAMKKRRLPQRYAREFLRRTKKHWLKKSFGWSEFLSLMEQKEPVMLRAFNSLSVSKSGTLQKGQVLTLLRNAGLPATEENAAAMMRFLDSDTSGSITYGQFRNFLVLVPPERLFDDPRLVWFEAATVVPISPPIEGSSGSVLKSALAGGLACALSTSLLHPLDTLKTRVQASTMSFPELISNIPNIGVRGLYRGYAPAILGQFSSHGLRTGIFEASKLLLVRMVPNVSELQVQSLASFCSTFLGTALRIPCEVLKQRLQAGLYDNVGEAIAGTLQKDGWKGFFRGTGATLCREVPFYVAGMMIYEEAKKVVQNVIKRELAPWEVIVIGGLSGGLAAVCTTPFDVMKTRMMTSPPGVPVSMASVTVKIVSEEGLLALFKGAVPRFFWIAPLGAMNFAGYELAKRAMEKKDQ